MPIYEYVCQSCHQRFEHLARTMTDMAADQAKVPCPACESARTSRTLSVFAVGGEGSATRGEDMGASSAGMCGRCGGPGPCGGGGF